MLVIPDASSQSIPRSFNACSSSAPVCWSSCCSISHGPRCTIVTLSQEWRSAAAASTPSTPPPSTTTGPVAARMVFTSFNVRKVNTFAPSLPATGGMNGCEPVANTSSSQRTDRCAVRISCAARSTAITLSPVITVTPRA
ncbi:hypothetical protein D3C78_1066210 [compost metagenome]